MLLYVIFLSVVMIHLCCECDGASDLWEQLEIASKLESDLSDTGDPGRKWLVISILVILNLFPLLN